MSIEGTQTIIGTVYLRDGARRFHGEVDFSEGGVAVFGSWLVYHEETEVTGMPERVLFFPYTSIDHIQVAVVAASDDEPAGADGSE